MFESILFRLLVLPGSLSLTHARFKITKYEIAYDKYRESLSCPHPPMHDNIVYRRSHRLAIWRYEKWPYRPTLICSSFQTRVIYFKPVLSISRLVVIILGEQLLHWCDLQISWMWILSKLMILIPWFWLLKSSINDSFSSLNLNSDFKTTNNSFWFK